MPNIVDFTGQTRFVSDSELPGELARGARLESTGESGARLTEAVREQEYGGFGGGAAAVGLGLARGVSFGGSDWLATHVFGANPANVSGYREENPGLSVGSELAGALVPGLLSGGTGAVGGVARALPSGALLAKTGRLAESIGGLKGLVAAGSLEGAAFGAGQGVSNLALSNNPVTVESALNEVGLNALFGVAGGAGGAAVGRGLEVAGGALLGRAGRGATKYAANEAEDLLTGAAHDIKNVTSGLERSADDVLDTTSRIAIGEDIRGTPNQLRKAAQERFEILQKHATSLREEARAVNLGERKLSKMNQSLADNTDMARTLLDPGLRLDSKSYARVRNKLVRLEGNVRNVAKDLDTHFGSEGKFGFHQKVLDDVSAHDNQWHHAMDTGQFSQRLGPRAARRVNEPNPVLQQSISEANQARSEFRAAWGLGEKGVLNEAALKRFTRMNTDEMTKAATAWSNWRGKLEELAHGVPDAELPITVKGFTGQFDRALSEAIPGDVAGMSGGDIVAALGLYGFSNSVLPDFDGPADDLVKLWLAHKLTRAPGALTRGIGGSRIANAAAGYVGSRVGGAVSKLTGGGGAASYWLRSEMAHIARSALKGGSRIAGAVGKTANRIEGATGMLLKGGGKATRRVGPQAATILNNAKFLPDSEKATPAKKTNPNTGELQAAFQERRNELVALIANPLRAHQLAFDNLREVRAAHPLIADQMEMEAVADLQFLYSKMPLDPGTMMRFGQSTWSPDERELTNWASYINAANDVVAVVERAASGSINPQEAEFLRTRRPALFAKIQETLARNVAQLQENTTFDARGRLSILFGVPVDSAHAQEMVEFQKQFWADRTANQEPLDPGKFQQNQSSEAQDLLKT